jgi:diguanylate cyclase (GGDEF)-like protein
VPAVRTSDIVARLGGDEFVVLIEGFSDPADLRKVASKVARAINRPVLNDGNEIRVSSSIGVAIARVGQDERHFMEMADKAMYRAKSRGPGCCSLSMLPAGTVSGDALAAQSKTLVDLPVQ